MSDDRNFDDAWVREFSKDAIAEENAKGKTTKSRQQFEKWAVKNTPRGKTQSKETQKTAATFTMKSRISGKYGRRQSRKCRATVIVNLTTAGLRFCMGVRNDSIHFRNDDA